MSKRQTCFLLITALAIGLAAAVYFFAMEERAGSVLSAARQAAARHDYRQARIQLEDYLKSHPESWQAWLFAAQTARQLKDFQQAALFQQKALRKGAPGESLAMEQRLLPIHAGNLQKTDDILADCTGHPDREEAALQLEAVAEGSLRAQDVPRLRRTAKLWLEQRSSTADQVLGLLWLGQADKMANEAGPALANFQKAVDLDPDHTFARILLVATLVHDRPEEAREHLDLLRRHQPNDLEVLFQTARMYRYLGQPEEAARLLDTILARNPDGVPALIERARVAMDVQHPAEALPLLQKVLTLAPRNRSALVTAGDCMRQLGKAAEATGYLNTVREIDEKTNHQQAKWKKKT